MKKSRIAAGLLAAALTVSLIWIFLQNQDLNEAARRLEEAQAQLRSKDFLLAQRNRAAAPTPQLKNQPETVDNAIRIKAASEEVPSETQEEQGYPFLPVDPINGPYSPIRMPPVEGRTTLAELNALQALPPIQAKDYVVKARLLNAAGESVTPQAAEIRAGQRSKLELIREFPYPKEFDPPGTPANFGAGSVSFSVTPTTPQAFSFMNTGWTTEVEFHARGGLLIVKGTAQNFGLESFQAMPGETGKPIYDEHGVLLSDNKQLQPSFTIRETPFTFDILPMKVYRLPLNAGDPGTVLEVTAVLAE